MTHSLRRLGVADIITKQQSAIRDTLRPLISPGQPAALLDFPHHDNVGDSAIWLGEKAALAGLGVPVVYQSDHRSFSADQMLRRLGSEGVILLHGGGSFGTVWPTLQRFRETVVQACPGNTIVQLPQTVFFADNDRAAHARTVLGSHPNFTVLVRDTRSLAFTRDTLGLRALLCPDMAFMLGALPRPADPEVDIVWLARSDREGSHPPPIPPPDLQCEVVDWISPAARPHSRLRAAYRRLSRYVSALLPSGQFQRTTAGETYDAMATRQVLRGLQLLCRGRAVVTDRLHGHILSLLLGIPHVLLDNSYGKVVDYHVTFTRGPRCILHADNPQDAIGYARRLLAYRDA